MKLRPPSVRRPSAEAGPSSRSSAFSLLELIVVLAILVMVAAMAVPNLMSMLRESHVFEAADRVRAAAGEARRFAIDSGIDYEFRYEVGGPAVLVLPSENELNVDQSDQSNTTEKYMRLLVELPEDLQLRGPDGVEETIETLDAVRFGTLQGDGLTRKTWSGPILFRFDGTLEEDGEIRVSDESGLTSRVTIRGLTGSSRVSQVYQEEL